MVKKAEVINENHYGSHHSITAKTYINVGNAYRRVGQNKHALKYLEKAETILEANYGK
jgi:hypothetical protein